MHTETRRRIGVLLVLCLATVGLYAQQADTVVNPFDRHWTKPRLVPRVGFGVQESGFSEIGVQFQQIYVHPLSLATRGPYVTLEGVWQEENFIFGPKAGYEFTAGLLGLAGDFTYYTDLDNDSWVFTPKAGLTLLGYVDFFYGRNIVLSDFGFNAISRHRFSLVFNINRDYFKIREERSKRSRD